MFAGLAAPPLAAAMRPGLAAAVWLLFMFSAMRIEWPGALREIRRPLLLLALLGVLLVAAPALTAIAVFRIFAVEDGLATALVLMAAAPPIMSSPALALLLGLDGALCLVIMVAATMAVPLVLPTVVLGLLGLNLAIDASALVLRLALFIATALVSGFALKAVVGETRLNAAALAIDGLAVILLVAFAIAIMDGVSAQALADPARVARYVAAAFAANLALQGCAAAACAGMGRRRALTVGFAAGNRNMALLLAVLPATSDSALLLFFALAQLPIYLLPAGLTPLYRRLLRSQASGSDL